MWLAMGQENDEDWQTREPSRTNIAVTLFGTLTLLQLSGNTGLGGGGSLDSSSTNGSQHKAQQKN